jgi:hypothetical protein
MTDVGMQNAPSPPRTRDLFELLLFTLQKNTSLALTLTLIVLSTATLYST